MDERKATVRRGIYGEDAVREESLGGEGGDAGTEKGFASMTDFRRGGIPGKIRKAVGKKIKPEGRRWREKIRQKSRRMLLQRPRRNRERSRCFKGTARQSRNETDLQPRRPRHAQKKDCVQSRILKRAVVGERKRREWARHLSAGKEIAQISKGKRQGPRHPAKGLPREERGGISGIGSEQTTKTEETVLQKGSTFIQALCVGKGSGFQVKTVSRG